MVRAILFDFYGVWTPEVFSEYLEAARKLGPDVASELEAAVGQYFQGQLTPGQLAQTFRIKLNRQDIADEQFRLQESDISPAITDFMRNLHGHFVKLGVLANLGTQEYELLNNFNEHNQLFEVIVGPLPLHWNQPLLSQQVFAAALQAIGEPPRNCLVVTSNLDYQRFAESLGMTALPFEGFAKLQEQLQRIVTSDGG